IEKALSILGDLGGGCRLRQLVEQHGECRALPQRRSDFELAAVAGDDVLHDGEAEARSALLPAGRNAHAVEPLCEAGQVLRRNALSIVLDGHGDPLALAAPVGLAGHTDSHEASFATVSDGVLNEVLEDLHQLVVVPSHESRSRQGFNLDRNTRRLRNWLEGLRNEVDNLVQLYRPSWRDM